MNKPKQLLIIAAVVAAIVVPNVSYAEDITIESGRIGRLNSGSGTVTIGSQSYDWNESNGNVLILDGGTLSLVSRSTGVANGIIRAISGTFTTSASGSNSNRTILNLGAGSSIAEAVNIDVDNFTSLRVTGGELYLDSNDTFTSNADVQISSGTLYINDASVIVNATGGNINVNGGTFTLKSTTYSPGSIAAEVVINSVSGSTINVSNGVLYINANDNILGGVSLASGGTINVDNLDFVPENYSQAGGRLNLTSSELSLNTGSSVTGGTVSLDSSTLNVQNGQETTASISAGSGSSLNVSQNSTINLSGGEIISDAALSVEEGSAININGENAILSIDSTDNYSGSLSLSDGTLNLSDKNLNTNENVNFNISGGVANLSNSEVSVNTENSLINGGTINLTNSSDLTVNNAQINSVILNSADTTSNTVNITGNSELELFGGTIDENTAITIEKDSAMTINASDASVSIDDNDTWNGLLELLEGELSINDKSAAASSGAIYQQTGGDLTVDNSQLTLDTADSYIQTGAVNLVNNSTINFANGQENTAVINSETENDLNLSNNSTLIMTGGLITEDTNVDIDAGSLFIIEEGAEAVLDNTDSWNGGVSLEGNLTMSGITAATDTNKTYNQSVNGGDSVLNLDNTSLTLNEGSVVSGGEINLANGSSLNFQNEVINTASINTDAESDASLSVAAGDTILTLKGGTITENAVLDIAGTLDINGADVTIDNKTDTLTGNLNLLSGALSLKEINKQSGFSQAGGTLNLAYTNLELTAEADILDGGTINLEDNSTLLISNGVDNMTDTITTDETSNNIHITNSSNYDIQGGYVVEQANVTIDSGSGLSVSGADVVLDSNTDTWEGALTLNSGSVSVNNFNSDSSISTDDTKKYNQTGGTLNLSASDITLNAGSEVSSGSINLTNASELYFNNGASNTATISANDQTTNILHITNNSTLTSLGGIINAQANVKIESGSTLDIEGSNSNITIGVEDDWSGSIILNNGNLNVSDGVHETTVDKCYVQTAGTLNLNNATLNLNTQESYISNGNVTLSNNSNLKFDNSKTDNSANITTSDTTNNSLTINNASGLTLTGGTINKEASVTVEEGGGLTIRGADVTIDKTDNWAGGITLASGTFSLSDELAATTTADKTYVQTGGSLYINNSSLVLDTAESYITDGIAYLQNGGTLTVANGLDTNGVDLYANDDSSSSLNIIENSKINLTGGVVDTAAKVNIENGSVMNLTGAEVIMDASSGDVWAGEIDINGGELTVSNTEHNNGVLNAVRGNLTLGQNTKLDLAEGSSIAASVRTVIEAAGEGTNAAELHIIGGSAAISANDTWRGDIYLKNGSLSYSGLSVNGHLYADDGTLTISSGSTRLNIDDDSYINKETDVSLTGSAILDVGDGTVYFNEGDNWTSTVVVDGKGTFDYSDLTSNGRFQAASGNVNVHSGILSVVDSSSYISEAAKLTLDEGATLKIENGNTRYGAVTINDGGAEETNDVWNGNVEMSGGTLNLSGYKKNTTTASIYNQTGGTLNLSNGTNLVLNEGSSLKGGTVAYASSGDTSSLTIANGQTDNTAVLSTSNNRNDSFTLSNNSGFTHSRGTIYADTSVNIGEGSVFNLGGSSNSYLSNLYLNSGDTWAGNVNLDTNYGRLYLDNAVKSETGSLTQSASSAITTVTGDGFVLNNSNDNISAGRLNIGSGSNAGSLGVLAGTIGSGAVVNLTEDSEISISGGNLTFNSGDTWKGSVEQTGGNLTLDSYTANGGLSASGGNLTLSGNTRLTLDGAGSNVSSEVNVNIGENTVVNLENNGQFTINEGDTWSGDVNNDNSIVNIGTASRGNNAVYTQDGVDAQLNVTGEGFVLANSSDSIAAGALNIGNSSGTLSDFTITNGKVEDAVVVKVYDNASLTVDNTSLKLSKEDSVDGTLKLNNGELTLEDFIMNGGYVQTGGTLDMYSSELHITDEGSSISGKVNMYDASILELGSEAENTIELITDNTANQFTLNAGKVTLDGSTSVNNEALVTISGGGELNLSSGEVNLNNNDSWAGTIDNDSALNLDGVSKTGTLVQDNASASISIIGEGFDLNAIGDEISAGSLSIGTSSNGGELTISAGTIGENANVTLNENSSISIAGGSLSLDDADIWGGDIDVNSGVLNILATDGRTGNLTLDGGTANIYTGFDITGEDVLSDGVLNLYNDLNLSDNAQIASDVDLSISRNTTVDIDETSKISINTNDTWLGSINNKGALDLTISKNTDPSSVYTQEGGELNISNSAVLTLNSGSSITNNGIVNLKENAGIGFNNGTANSAEITTLDDTANKVSVKNGTSLDLGSRSNINSSASVEFIGNVSLSGGNVTLNTGDTLAGVLTNTGGIVTFDGVNKTGNYIQSTDDALLNVLADATLKEGDSIDGGSLNIEGANLTLNTVSIADDIEVSLDNDAKLSISSGSSVYLSSEDTVNGSIANEGSLTVKDLTLGNSYSHNNAELIMDNSTFNSTDGTINGGSITLNNNSDLNISNGGENSISVITDDSNNTLGITNGSTVTMTGGNIVENAIVNITLDSTLRLDKASLTLNDRGETADKWDGKIEMTTADSRLELVDFASSVGELVAEKGNLVLSGNTSISLSDGLIAEEVALDIGTDSTLYLSGADLNLDSADSWGGSIVMNSEESNLTLTDMVTSDASKLSAEDGSLTLDNSTLNLTGTSKISSNVDVNIEADSTLNITGGNVTLDGLTDVWDGKLTISGGNLTLDDMTKSNEGVFQQTGGTTTILGTSFDMNNTEDYVKNGTLIVGDGINEALLTVSEGKIYEDASLVIKDKGEVNITNKGETEEGTGGIDWAGHVQVDGGKLTIDDTSKTGTLSQTGGEIIISGEGFDLNQSSDNLSGGSLTVDGTIGVSAGTIGAGNSLTISDAGEIAINGGNVTVNGGDIWNGLVDMTEGSLSVDGFTGSVSFAQTSGTLNLANSSSLNIDSTSSITGGEINIDNASLITSSGAGINNASVELTNVGALTVGGGNENVIDFLSDTSANKLTVTGNSDLTINSGDVLKQTTVDIQSGSSLNIANASSVTIDSTDTWNGRISLGSEDATLTLDDYVRAGTSGLEAEQGNVILDGSTVLTLADGTIAQKVKLSINEDARLNLSGASLTLDNADTWLGTIGVDNADSVLTLIGMNIGDDANLIASKGNLVLDNTTLTIGGTSNINNDVNLNIDSDSIVNLTNGDLNINDGDIWDGVVNNKGGQLTVNKNTTNKTGVLSQETTGASTTVLGASFDLNNTLDNISAGTLTVGNGVDSALLTISKGTVDSGAQVNITQNSDILISGGDITLNSNDVWTGDVSISSGELTLDGGNKTGTLEQSGGKITIASDFTLNNSADSLNGGNLHLNNEAEFTINNGSVGSNTAISMSGSSRIEVAGGELNLNNDDIWSEQISVSGGTLNIYDPIKTGSLVQSSGVTNILQDFTLGNTEDNIYGGKLSIAEGVDLTVSAGQITADAAVELNNNSELLIAGGSTVLNKENDTWNGKISHSGGNLTVSGYDTTNTNGTIQSTNGALNIQDGHLTIADGSSIGINTELDINNGTSLDITGGTAELNGNDTWSGDIALSDGSLILSDVDKTTGTDSSFIQSGGELSLSGSDLSLNDAESFITNGDVSLDNSGLTINDGSIADSEVSLGNSSNLTISNGTSNSADISTDTTGNSIAVSGSGTQFEITGGTVTKDTNVTIGAGAEVNITGEQANVTLDGLTDVWDGKLTISGGNLTLDDMTKSNEGVFQQTGGTTTILGTSFDMNNTEDYVKNGTLIVGDGINEALLTVSEGKIYEDASLVIKDKGEVNITNKGETEEGTGGIDWAGHVQVDGGKLTIDDTSKTGTLSQTGGEIIISGEGFDLNQSSDNLSGGSLTVDGTIGVSAGTIGAGNSLTISDAGEIAINGGNVTVNGGDIWNGLVDMTDGNLILDGANKNGSLSQSGGKTVITGDFNLNNSSDLISGGELQVQDGTLTVSQGTVSANADVNINTGANVSITQNGSFSLDNEDIWNGNVNVSGGSLVISEINDKAGSLTQTSGNISITGDFNLNNENDLISGGSLTISDDAKLTVSAGSIEEGADIDLNTGSEINIAGGSVTIGANDTWNGDVSLSSGELSITQNKETTQDSTFNQTGGTLDLSSSLTLNEGSTITGDSIVNITGGHLVLNNNAQNNGNITVDDSSTLGIADGSSLTLTGGTIADGSVLDMSGNLILDGAETVVNIGTNDIWNGNITVSDGSLNLTADKITNSSSTYNQTGGNLSISSGAGLTLGEGSEISGGNVALNNGSITAAEGSSISSSAGINMTNSSSLVLDNGKDNTISITTDTTSNSIDINQGSGLTVVGGEIVSETELGIYGNLNINNEAIVTVDGTDAWDGKISLNDGTLILENVTQAGSFEAQSGTLKIFGSNTSLGENLVVNKGVTTVVDENSTLNISGGSVTFDTNSTSNDDWAGSITMSSGSFTLTDNFLHETEGSTYNQTGGTLHIDNGAGLTINDALSSITDASIVELGNNGKLSIANGKEHSAELKTSGSSDFNLSGNSTFTTSGNTNIAGTTDITIASGSTLNVSSGNVTFDGLGTNGQSDKWDGKVNIDNSGKLTIASSDTGIGADSDITSGNLEMNGGTLSLTNTVLAMYDDTNDILKSGTVEIDKYSRINLALAWANSNIDVKSAGMISSANNVIEANSLGGLIIDNVNGRADFSIDIYENSGNSTYTTDTFDFSSITSTNTSGEAVVNISDFNLIQSNPGATAPSQTVNLGNIFDADTIGENVKFTTTADEYVTPVNRYQLTASSANDGSYFLNVTGYNQQAYRGQVVSVAQMMNQLVVNDILFDRLTLTPQTLARTSTANRLAIQDTKVLPGYEYTRHDPGIWVKTYGNFETLRMTEDLDVENSAYGSLVGVDMGTFDIGKGWSWIPTVYMGYIGAHQSYSGVSAYENGGQVGAMGTFFNKNWIASVLGYASLYNVEMSVRGNNDQDMNYYAGTAVKAAYNWRIKDRLIIQPTATVSYNFFGGPSWRSNYGQIGMTTGTLNGLNVAPGVNFIWQQETWNLFATVAYVYNCVGGVSGTASGVELPDIWMDRGYLQYGFGISKELTDRLSFFAQVILRNVGRTGIGFQGELEYRF